MSPSTVMSTAMLANPAMSRHTARVARMILTWVMPATTIMRTPAMAVMRAPTIMVTHTTTVTAVAGCAVHSPHCGSRTSTTMPSRSTTRCSPTRPDAAPWR